MKPLKSITLLVINLSLGLALNAQAPQKMNYQAVARNSSGQPLVNQNINVQFKIHDATASGTVLYTEEQQLTTSSLGLFTAAIGGGTVVGTGTFAGINWASGDKYLEVGIDPNAGGNYTSIGTSQLLSVPYALYAATSGSGGSGPWATSGNNISNTNSGNVGIGTATPDVALDVHSSATTEQTNGLVKILEPNMAANTKAYIKLGKALSTADEADIYFKYAGAGSTSNYLGIGFYGLPGIATFTAGGNVGIGQPTPAEKLDIGTGNVLLESGNLKLNSGEVQRTQTGDANLVPIAYGQQTSSTATIAINSNASTSNFTITRSAAGIYQIAVTGVSDHNNIVVVATPNNIAPTLPFAVSYLTTTNFVTLDMSQWNNTSKTFSGTDTPFNFVVYSK